MVEPYKEKHFFSLQDFVSKNINEDFYFIENNVRIVVKDFLSLKKMLKFCSYIYIIEEKGDILGIIMLWKTKVNELDRYYIKLHSSNKEYANNLLTQLLWNIDKPLYIKINKKSAFLKVFYNKKFEFRGEIDDGKSLLLVHINKPSRKINDKPIIKN